MFFNKKIYVSRFIITPIKFTRLKKFLLISTYKSLRYKSFLPLRGQSTRTNAKTSKKRRSAKSKK